MADNETVLFLDGPLAGQERQVQADATDRPKYDLIEALQQPTPQWDADDASPVLPSSTVTYRVKRSRFRRGPKWVAALGEKVGERVQCVQVYTLEARQAMGVDVFNKIVERHAREALARTCAEVGLVPDDVHKAFAGSLQDAESWLGPWPKPYEFEQEDAARTVLQFARDHRGGCTDLQYVVYHAVAMPAPKPEVEAVGQWA
ncbi:hypothetical protein PBI_OMNICRON_86 [Mycobacterium phage Omnicron]|uniref:Uncharacterized protein n=1 Tax=Mycobacterium phage Omnicron TaxID=1541819 RepID=A0A088FUW4_9CAUD|nr:hypothetical protein PBI_OMNICRON_86 [Mycobacterium phage Omnicron]AIM50419.1 hypothetical protein PBI_OMNICRON_86 [Mycobacterium phage Omnicron]